MKNSSLTGIGGIFTAVLASLCCIGPVVFAFIGIGSIGIFSIFEAYRPYLIVFSIILLSVAFYFTYKKREVHCEDGSCTIESAGKWNKASVWIAAIISIGVFLFPYSENTPPISTAISLQGTTTAYLRIHGMDCKSCAIGIEGSLSGLPGVQYAHINFEEGTAMMGYDSTIAAREMILQRISDNGFKGIFTRIQPVISD